MRTSIFACLICMSFTTIQAQYFGIRGGYNFTSASVDINNLEVETGDEGNLMLGLYVDLPIGTEFLTVQPEINYMGRGYSLTSTVISNDQIETSLAYLDIGGLVKLNLGVDQPIGFYVGAGPFLNYAISGTIDENGDERDIDFDADRIKRSELSVAAAAGVTLGNFFAEVRYMGSLSNLSDDDEVDISQRSIGINGGFRVPLF
ncbi:MAG: porin family protein [Bacteroidota bacterium]